MKHPSFLLLCFLAVGLLSCSHGDKTNTIGATFADEDDFVNAFFTGNKVDLSEAGQACEYVSKANIAGMLGIPVEQVNSGHNPAMKQCAFTIIYDEEGPDYTTAGFRFNQEVTGVESEWKDNWKVAKAISKTAEWVPNLGKAAIWKPASLQLEVKFEGYTLSVTAPRGPKKDEGKSKKWAIEMVKLGGFV